MPILENKFLENKGTISGSVNPKSKTGTGETVNINENISTIYTDPKISENINIEIDKAGPKQARQGDEILYEPRKIVREIEDKEAQVDQNPHIKNLFVAFNKETDNSELLLRFNAPETFVIGGTNDKAEYNTSFKEVIEKLNDLAAIPLLKNLLKGIFDPVQTKDLDERLQHQEALAEISKAHTVLDEYVPNFGGQMAISQMRFYDKAFKFKDFIVNYNEAIKSKRMNDNIFISDLLKKHLKIEINFGDIDENNQIDDDSGNEHIVDIISDYKL